MGDLMLHPALRYAELGWFVFPCGPDKRPVTTSYGKPLAWSKWATKDADIVRRMWSRYPGSNIGIACKPSGLVVIDCDRKNGIDGLDTLVALQAQLGFDLMTVRETTPTMGLHFIYRAAGQSVGNSAGKLGPGLDIRGGGDGEGGYIVCSPSMTPTGGYYWIDTVSPFEIEPLPFPAVLVELLNAKPEPSPRPPSSSWRDGLQTVKSRGNGAGYAGAALANEINRVTSSTQGTRNVSLNQAAFALGRFVADGRLDAVTVEDTLLEAGLRAGLAENETRATIASGFKARGV